MSETIWLFPNSRLRYGNTSCKFFFSFLYLFLTFWPIGATIMFTTTITGFLIMYFGGWDNLLRIYKDFFLEDYLIIFGILCVISGIVSLLCSFILVIMCIRRHKLDTMIRLLSCQHCQVDQEYLDDTDTNVNFTSAQQHAYQQLH